MLWEHRRAPRLRCLRPARCVFDKGYSVIEVTVKNISQSGARISSRDIKNLPATFELWIPDGFGEDKRRLVRRVWIRGDTAGVTFNDAFKV
ncbi:MAG: PilZ domain-containing protein [Roseiarcus sp.]